MNDTDPIHSGQINSGQIASGQIEAGPIEADPIRAVARDSFGWEELRPGQRTAIEGVVGGRDTLAVMPTGYGKSAIYQVAAVLLAGPTVVVSPLIALQFDQIAGIEEHDDAPDAVAVNSGQGERANQEAWRAITTGGAEYLFLSPEQFAKDEVVERLAAIGVRLFVVDEAHCVSSWGHDFRPDYLRLAEVIERLGHPTVLALTATGSPPVRDEIVERLGLRGALVLTHGFDRPNLRLEVRRHESDSEKRDAVVDSLIELPTPGLLYAATRRDTERYAEKLVDRGIRAIAYHAGQSAAERRESQEAFREGDADVVVATSAFGMGIDKRDVRFVVHAAVPDSLDSYYQEAGRAGRDGEPATVTLHYRSEDLGLRSFFASGLPSHESLREVFEAVRDSGGPIRLNRLASRVGMTGRGVSRLVNLLEQAGYLSTGRSGIVARADNSDDLDSDDAARRAIAVAEDRERIELSRIAMMRSYAETRECRRRFLLGYFGEDLAEPCGNCDTCTNGSAYEVGEDADDEPDDQYGVDSAVTHVEWGDGIVMRAEEDRITVFFETEGYKVLSRELIEERKLLTVKPS
jgi:ATP-dependent DNA helicase RecQ